MAFIISKFLERLGASRGEALSTEHDVASPVAGSDGQPQVEPGSTLDAVASLNPLTALTYVDAVASEIKQAIAINTIIDPTTSNAEVLEQIHSLKNAIAPTGSRQLLSECEQLRQDASLGVSRAKLAQSYMAVGSAATQLIRNYRRSLSKDIENSGLSTGCDRHDPQA